MNKNEIQDKLKQMEEEMETLRKKLDEPERELYRGWIPKVGEDYCVIGPMVYTAEFMWDDLTADREWMENSPLPICKTEAEAQAIYERHMAGEMCKKIISKWIAELEPGWKPNWKHGTISHYLCLHYDKYIHTQYVRGGHDKQDEWYFPEKVANCRAFLDEVEPHFRKWLGVE